MLTINKLPGQRVLELGGGTNRNPAADVHTDIRKVDGVDFETDLNSPNWPISSDEFDCVFSQFCAEHISWRNTKQFLQECFRVCKPGGVLVLVVPNTEAQMRYILSKPEWDGDEGSMLFGDQNYAHNHHCSAWSPRSAMKLLIECGWENVVVSPISFNPATPPGNETDMRIDARKPAGAVVATNGHTTPPAVKPPDDNLPPELRFIHTTKLQPVPPQPPAPAAPPAPRRDWPSAAAVFDRQYFDGGKLNGGYAGEGYRDWPAHEITARKVLERKPESVLELGAGRGYVLKRLQDKGVRCCGLDVSQHCWLTRVIDSIFIRDLTETPWPLKDGGFDLCCHPDTLIHTKNGVKRIGQVRIGDEVLTHRGRYRKVTNTFQRRFSGELIGIRPYYFGDTMFVTPNHPVLAKVVEYREKRYAQLRHTLPTESFVRADSLTTEDVSAFAFPTEISDTTHLDMRDIPQPGRYSSYERVMEARASGKSLYAIKAATGVAVKTSHQWVTGTKWPRGCWKAIGDRWYSSSLDFQGLPVKTVVDNDFCRFVGYFLSDGCSSTDNNHTTIVFSADQGTYADDVESIVHKHWDLTCRRREQEETITVQIDSRGLAVLLKHFIYEGENRKALQKKIPAWMMNLPQDKQAHLLRGLLRGDGSVTAAGWSYKLATSSLQMVATVKLLCLRLGIIPGFRVQSDGGETRIKDHVARMARSYSMYIKATSPLFDTFNKERIDKDRDFQFGWIENCLAFCPIRKIEKQTYSGCVYNLEVEEDNSYTTTTCTVHNCTSMAFLEHVQEDALPTVLQEMKRVCKRGLHGVFYSDIPTNPDGTKRTLRPAAWWRSLFDQHGLTRENGWEVLDKDELENGPIPDDYRKGDGRLKILAGSFTTCSYHGWLNCDVVDLIGWAQSYGYQFARIDVRQGLPFSTGVVDCIACFHMLEHLSAKEGVEFLRECRRVIRADGAMRLAVPNAHALAEMYLNGRLGELDEMNGGCAEQQTPAGKFWAMLGAGHQAAIDEATLHQMLEDSGWVPLRAIFRQPGVDGNGTVRPAQLQILRETTEMDYGHTSLFMDAIPKLA